MTNEARAEHFRKWCLANGVEFGIRGSAPFLNVLAEHFKSAIEDMVGYDVVIYNSSNIEINRFRTRVVNEPNMPEDHD